MRFYFLSNRPCALKVGGLYVGKMGSSDLFLDIPIEDEILCEIVPLDASYRPITFVIDENFLAKPPIPTIVCPTAILLKAESFIRNDPSMKLIAQECYTDATVSIFLQGTTQASIERGSDISTFPLPDQYERASIYRKNDCILLVGKNHITIIDLQANILLSTPFIRWALKEELSLTIPHYDSMNHYTECTYALTNRLELKESVLKYRFEAKPELYLYALLERLLLDADVCDYVTDELNGRIHDLKAFLGHYTSVLYITEDVAGLVYPVAENLSRMTYFTADYLNGKISNIKEKAMQ